MSGKSSALLDRQTPARNLAARAASKHGSPAENAMFGARIVEGGAADVAARLFGAAHAQRRSFEGLALTAYREGEGLERGSFALTLRPDDARFAPPAFEGHVRVDQLDAAHCRVVLTGRYALAANEASADIQQRASAEATILRVLDALIRESRISG